MIDAGTAALYGAAIGGLAGVVGQVAASWFSRSRVREARNQDRLERTYVEVMTQVNRTSLTVQRIEPAFWFGDKPPKVPKPISDDEMLRLNSLIGLFGSDRVLDALAGFRMRQTKFNSAVLMRRSMTPDRSSYTAGQLLDASQAVDETRSDLLAHAKLIEAAARGELRGQRRWRPAWLRRPAWAHYPRRKV
jgi:hypothetical protein